MGARKLPPAKTLVNWANKVQDSLQVFPDLKHHSCADAYFYMAAYCARTAPAELLEWAFELCRENMKPMYERVWGWSDNKKRRQIFAASSRFIVAYQLQHRRKAPVAYINYRFEVEESQPVLYVYEVQVAHRAQKKGLASRCMHIVERLAQHHSMAKVMLTVFKDNEAAMCLYRKLGYSIDEASPDYGSDSEQGGLSQPPSMGRHKEREGSGASSEGSEEMEAEQRAIGYSILSKGLDT